MEKMCVTHIFDKELIFKIYEEVIQLKSENNLILKWSDYINKLFFFFKTDVTNGQQVHQKKLNICNHQKNAHQHLNKACFQQLKIM